jgi:hypothetical protein
MKFEGGLFGPHVGIRLNKNAAASFIVSHGVLARRQYYE